LEQKPEDSHILAIEDKLNSLTQRLVELERRLSALERATKRATIEPPRSNPARLSLKGPTYIERVIDSVRREFNRER
jgi:hypothetical protein